MPIEQEDPFNPSQSFQSPEAERNDDQFEFTDLETAKEYLAWKQEVPAVFRHIVESTLKNKAPLDTITGLTLTDQFLKGCAESLRTGEVPNAASYDPLIMRMLEPLAHVETKGGYTNVFSLLGNTDTSWKLKQTLYETQIRVALEFLINKDLEKLSQEALKEQELVQTPEPTEGQPDDQGSSEERPVSPPEHSPEGGRPMDEMMPPESEEVRSSMEGGSEKREGEPSPIFLVKPFFGGYYKQQVFSEFHEANHRWGKKENQFEEATSQDVDVTRARVESGMIRGRTPLALPVPYDWAVDPESVATNAPADSVTIYRNQNGLWYMNVDADGAFPFTMTIAPLNRTEEGNPFEPLEMTGELPEELTQGIESLRQQHLPRMKLAREVVKLVRNSLKYSNSPDAWKHYVSQPQGFFNRLWQRKEADCFVANTLAVRALGEVDASAHFVSGYFVKEVDKSGSAIMHSGNGHAWLEVWDELSERPVRLDATPKGDPAMDEEQQERELEGETGEGDFGERDDEIASEEEVKKKIEELKKKQGGEGKRKGRLVELAEQQFATLAECTPQQAREFLQALERVRKITDREGHSISDAMKNEWRKIVEERKVESRDYRGPVRMDEGSRLDDPVAAAIDITAKEFNPTGFEKDTRVERTETDFGGMNIYFSFDLSGSMAEPDAASGRAKKEVQRDVALLFVDSLMQAAVISRREGSESNLLPIKIMATVASQTGETKLSLTDKWGPKEQWALYSALTQVARGGTPTHRTLQLIQSAFEKEVLTLRTTPIPAERLPLHYTAEISDGAPDDASETEAMHHTLKKKGMAIRSYTIGGASASADAAPPIASFSQLPEILAEDIIKQFKRLRPHKIKP